MIKKFLFIVFIVLFGSRVLCAEGINSDISLSVDFESKSITIPLKQLEHKTVRPPSEPDEPFIFEDGVYGSEQGNYLEGLCRFKDTNGDRWQIKFSCELLSDPKYSIISIIVLREDKVKQQNDFSFRGKPGDILNMQFAPFRVIGLKTRENEWFSVTLKVR
ncbi:MAG: hypothetical protein ACOC8Q_02155 [Desulfosalsimonas sp.]